MTWISIKRFPPPESEDVILTHFVWRKGDKTFTPQFFLVGKWVKNCWFDSYTGKNLTSHLKKWKPTHWCELPSLPCIN